MTDLDVAARRIREAFERDLAGYRAPSDLAERARLGGLRRARRRRGRRAAYVAVIACAAAASVVAGTFATGLGRGRPGPASPPAAVSPRVLPAAKSAAGLPSAAAVSRAMLTSFSAASGDILYERFIDTGPGSSDESQYWFWPAQPIPGQQVRERDLWAQNYSSSARAQQPTEDWATVYTSPVHPPPANDGFTTSILLTMVCYPPGGCGWGSTQTPGRTWSKVRFQGEPETSDISAGGDFNPAVLAQAIAHGQWRVVRRTRLDGQHVIELSETAGGPISPLPVDLWVNAQTYLPLRCDGGGSSEVFGYLPPTAVNLALLQVPVPRGFPRSDPFRR